MLNCIICIETDKLELNTVIDFDFIYDAEFEKRADGL